MPNGKLITCEGIDGSGKSTQAKLLTERLRASGKDCALFREPGGTPLGEQVRKILLDQPDKMGAMAEMLLFSAARAELVRQIIKPALAQGCIVILDRFTDSTTAYQGYGRGLDLALIETVNRASMQGVEPAVTFLFDIAADEALNRHRRTHDRMEQEGVAFMEKVRRGYLSVAESYPGRIAVLDGTKAIEALAEEVWNKVFNILNI